MTETLELMRQQHPLLARAAVALGDGKTPRNYRRAIAGEYVNAWADAYDLALADCIREELRSTERLIAALKLSSKKAG